MQIWYLLKFKTFSTMERGASLLEQLQNSEKAFEVPGAFICEGEYIKIGC